HVAGIWYALPSLPGGELPDADAPVRVGVVQVDEGGLVRAWNPDAEALFRHPADDVLGRPCADFVSWPQSAGIGLGLAEPLRLARDLLGCDAAYLMLATEDETEFEVRAATGLSATGRRLSPIPIDSGAGRFDSARLPAVHEDLAVRPTAAPLLIGTGLRSLITVPLKVEGRLTGSLGVAAAAPGRFDNEDALRLQFAADRIALA